GYLPHFAMDASFLRVCVTTAITEAVFIPLVWFVALDDEEREYVKGQVVSTLMKMRGENK
ncbi:MAG: hypothetical protein IKJ45_17475, partial [Kiritimatiellae bacterium]|nr:hypothetical protein [Kiritimatiellia bacterium]